jgi:hypothetical protein
MAGVLEKRQIQYEIHHLAQLLPVDLPASYEAADVLVIKKGADHLLSDKGGADALFEEARRLTVDRREKSSMGDRLVNCHKNYTNCITDEGQTAVYAEGKGFKGTNVAFSTVPLIATVRERLPLVLKNNKLANLVGETNVYPDLEPHQAYVPDKEGKHKAVDGCGIGVHGDRERKITVGIRLGEPFPLVFGWFHKQSKKKTERVGELLRIDLEHGDIYIMSEKATGRDCAKNGLSVQHGAGRDKANYAKF